MESGTILTRHVSTRAPHSAGSGFQLDLEIALSGGSSEGQRPRASQLGRRCAETSGDVIEEIFTLSWKLVEIYLFLFFRCRGSARSFPFRCLNGRDQCRLGSLIVFS